MTRGIFIQQGGTITPKANSSMTALRDIFGDRILAFFIACWFRPTWCNLVTFCEEVCKIIHIKKWLTERNGYELLDIVKHFKEFPTTFSPVIKHVWELEVIFSACLNVHWYCKTQISNINYMSGFHFHLDTLQPSSIAEFANPLFKTQLDIAVPVLASCTTMEGKIWIISR
jgi:hypothetical protein